MKKFPLSRICCFLLCIILLAYISPNGFADDSFSYGKENHECNAITFDIPLSGEISGPLEAGNYYLTENCKATCRVLIKGEVNICLNGFIFITQGATTLQVEDGNILNLYDCTGEGHVGYIAPGLNNHPITLRNGGTVNLFHVFVWSKAGPSAIDNYSGTLNIFDSIVQCDGVNSDGIGIKNWGIVNFYGGQIIGRYGIIQRSDDSTVNLYAGSISAIQSAVLYAYDNRKVSVIPEEFLWRITPDDELVSSTFVHPQLDEKSLRATHYLEILPEHEIVNLQEAPNA